MKKSLEQSLVRYNMTHGEMLPTSYAYDKIPLSVVAFTLEARESRVTLSEFKKHPYILPERSVLTFQYRGEDRKLVSLDKEATTRMNPTQAQDIKKAMELASESSRPVITYTCLTEKNGAAARLVAAYMNSCWYCVHASNISYPEANFVYELLVKNGLAH